MSQHGNGRDAATIHVESPPSSFETRLMQSEARLVRDELLLARDEARIARDEARLTLSEHANRTNRALAMIAAGIGVVLIIALVSLVIAVFALQRDVNAIEQTAPAHSVTADSLRDGAVTADKLAAGSVTSGALANDSVTRAALAAGSVGAAQIAQNAVTGSVVRPNSLTGADVAEGTLQKVPYAGGAANAKRLANLPASAYVGSLTTRRVATSINADPAKGPLAAHCPSGTRAISGGALIGGSAKGVAIVQSEPRGGVWLASARAPKTGSGWQLIATAICAKGGR